MPPSRPRPARILALVAAAAFVAAVYAWGILSNFCVDSDTLNWASSLAPLRERMTFLNCIVIKGWFTKFHLLMFSAVYAVAGLCALWGPWDFLLAFKLFTLVCAVATVPLLFSICRDTMKIFPVMLVISLIPLFTIGYSWLIITADDNPTPPEGDIFLMGYSKGSPDILTLLTKRPDLAPRIKGFAAWAGAVGGSYAANDIMP